MTEKEERITIHKVLYPCKKCSINCNKNDWEDCDFYQNYISGMTRQEAIERMAKAMCHSPSGTCEDCFARESKKACNQAMFGMKELAEAALDALLSKED